MTKAQMKRRLKRIVAIFFRIHLRNRSFSIISNNCWGGVVYDKYALPYLTPTIGLWIPPSDFVKLLSSPDYYFNHEMVQINYKESNVSELLIERKRTGRYTFDLDDLIIGQIDDINIVFIHYHSFDEAKTKWDRRKNRINWNNCVIKLNDQNGCTKQDFDQFAKLPYDNKLFFTAKKEWASEPFCVYFEKYEKDGYVVNDTGHHDVPIKMTPYLNKVVRRED